MHILTPTRSSRVWPLDWLRIFALGGCALLLSGWSGNNASAKIAIQFKDGNGPMRTVWTLQNDALYDETTNTLYLAGAVPLRSLIRELDYSSDKGQGSSRSPKIRLCLIQAFRCNVSYKAHVRNMRCPAKLACAPGENPLDVIVTAPANRAYLNEIEKKIQARRGIQVKRVSNGTVVTTPTPDCQSMER